MAILTVPANIDSYIDGIGTAKNLNFGGDNKIRHGVTYFGAQKLAWYRGIGNFDVSALQGLAINSAKLVREVFSIANGGVQGRLSRCTRPSQWTESGVTWNRYDGTNLWTNEGGDFDDTGPPAKIDYTEPTAAGTHEVTGLKGFVEDALNNRNGVVSLITRLVDENPGVGTIFQWHSKEQGADSWRLVIDYTPLAAATLQPRRAAAATPFASRPRRAPQGSKPEPPRAPARGRRPHQLEAP